jgi:hypothetical protein
VSDGFGRPEVDLHFGLVGHPECVFSILDVYDEILVKGSKSRSRFFEVQWRCLGAVESFDLPRVRRSLE